MRIAARIFAVPSFTMLAAVACSSGSTTTVTTAQGTSSPASASTLGTSVAGLTAPQFPGQGTSFAGLVLQPGVLASTAGLCSAPPTGAGTVPPGSVKGKTTCYYGDMPDPTVPAAAIEEILEAVADTSTVHLRITFNPDFVDNSYGDNAIGWGGTGTTATSGNAGPGGKSGPGGPGGHGGPGGPGGHGHTFKDLVESDHVELTVTNGAGATAMVMDVDYISQDASAPCGYSTLGVNGGEGKVITGNASDVVGVATSLSRDLNGCGYCLTDSSPATDSSYTPNATYPKWDYRVVYEVWLDARAFGNAGFGDATINLVHASPSKLQGANLPVSPGPCPPTWTNPCCTVSTTGDGLDCVPTGTEPVDTGSSGTISEIR